MKKFLILSIVLLSGLSALACGPSPTPNYYMFSVYNRNQMDDIFATRMTQYWTNYTDGKADKWDMMGLFHVDTREMKESTNCIVQTALAKNDQETLDYLQLLIKYMQACDAFDENRWNYPTAEEKAAALRDMQYINNRARSYEGARYRSQYGLLVMRTYMMMNKPTSVMQTWETMGKSLPESVYKDKMKNIYAWGLLKSGKRQEACEIYAEQGDMTSIKWCVRDKRNLKGIKEEYAANPNSPTLVFLVQDFVNNAQETADAGSPEVMQYVEATSIYENEIKQFIAFAGDVVKKGKTKSPAMWQAASGFLNYMIGNQSAALKQLTEAQKMKGTQRMKDNARACYLLVATKDAKPDKKYYDFLKKELLWLGEKDKEDQTMGEDGYSSHYAEVINRVTNSALIPQFEAWNRPEVVVNLKAMLALYPKRDYMANSLNIFGEEWYMIDDLTAQETIDYRNYLNSTPGNDFERWLMTFVDKKVNNNVLNDLIGTKYLREGNFDAALPYLQQVPASYISTLGLSRYMARRDYHKERWMGRQIVDYESTYWSGEDYGPKEVKTNQRLEFCQDVIDLKRQLANARNNEEKAKIEYNLASILYQASYKGDCWYLTRYAQSAYDSIDYKNEADLIGQSIALLNNCKQHTSDFRLKEKALYALAFVPHGDEIFTYTYDADYNAIPHLNRGSKAFNAMNELWEFYYANRNKVSKFVSNCDALIVFSNLQGRNR
ncbi:MAG: hypothetical protein II683_04340 [Muribaculaceae bacterium]|nr:hypothetical protein [Muribaculaceae bacterium]